MTARRSFSHTEGAELSVARINRLLRPLRNKCAILRKSLASATSRPSGSGAPITYGSSTSPSLETRVPPSLDVLRDPKLVISRAHQESRFLDDLARQIYAVTNAYRNVVQTALRNDVSESCPEVLSLTDICAASVGWNIQAEVARGLATLEESDEAEETALVDELYESVPARFRRCAASISSNRNGHRYFMPAGGPSLRTRHPSLSTPALVTPCSCSVFLAWRWPMVFSLNPRPFSAYSSLL